MKKNKKTNFRKIVAMLLIIMMVLPILASTVYMFL